MQKIFVVRHQARTNRDFREDYKRLGHFLRNELSSEGVEVYASLEGEAYMTGYQITTSLLRDKNIIFRDNQFQGIGPYRASHIETLSPFPLFELTALIEDPVAICRQVPPLFESFRGDHIDIDRNGMELRKALMHYIHQFSYKASKSPKQNIREIVARTTNNVVLVTHGGMVERIQREWGFPGINGEAPYLSGSIIIPSEGICKEFGPVTKYEVTKQVAKTSE